MRKILIAGNWKMNRNVEESRSLAADIVAELGEIQSVDLLICPPYTSLDRVHGVIAGTSIQLGAQDMHWEKEGAYTGKVSAGMLQSVGVTSVILGHSEQRTYFHETDRTVNQKTVAALEAGLTPIVCVGETLEEREGGKMEGVIRTQVMEGLKGFSPSDLEKIVIAYEPVWAIGTGKTASPEQAQDVHAFIRGLLKELAGDVSDKIRILYGGSMKPDNAAGLLSKPDIDGGLIGGASLKAADFAGIARAAG